MGDAEEGLKLYTETCGRFFLRIMELWEFQSRCVSALNMTKPLEQRETAQVVLNLLMTAQSKSSKQPSVDITEKYGLPKIAFTPEFTPINLAQGMAELTTSLAVSTVQRACLVFAHAVLEGALMDLIKAVAWKAPEAFQERIRNRTVPFQDAVSKSHEELRAILLARYLDELDRDSLLRKAEAIHAVCRGWQPPEDVEKYDLAHMEQFDRLRHRVVHELDALPKGFEIRDELGFILMTFFYFTTMLAEVHGFPEFDEVMLDGLIPAVKERWSN